MKLPNPLSYALLAMAMLSGTSGGLATEPVLRVVTTSGAGANLLKNPAFETRVGTSFSSWQTAPNGYRAATGEGRDGSQALACDAADETGWRGASQTLTLNRVTTAPLIVSGWSKAEGVTGGRDSGYSLYADLSYQDGIPLWGQTANFSTGTHDWERREVMILPEKPVKSITLNCLVRGHAGKVWFDDVSLVEVSASGNAVVFQGTPMELALATNPPASQAQQYSTADGLSLSLAKERVVSLQVDGRELASGSAGGFLVRDVAANSDVYAFDQGACSELGLQIETHVQTNANHLVLEGTLSDTRGKDRSIMLLFALPLDATSWLWGDDVQRERKVDGRGEFINATSIQSGTTGTLSLYPLATLHDDRTGVALGLDMAQAAQYRIVYHAGTRQFFLAWDFGLVPESASFPSAAKFRFVLFHFEPTWGFRAGWQKYMEIFPDHFAVRSRDQGIWMPFTDVSTVQGWEDFGFRYHEGNNNVAWDDAHGVLSFRYTEPTTWWMSMAPELPRTEAEALRVRDQYAAGAAGNQKQMALVSQTAAMFDANGHPELLFRNEPWANGAVWSLNPNPLLPAQPNAATVYWNDSIKTQLYGTAAKATLDGEYLDSLEAYVTADLNFRRDHFRYTTVPLTFSTDTHQPALHKALAVYEFTRWLSKDIHDLGKLMFANSVPYRFSFLCPWLDVMGTETDWLSGTNYQSVSHSQLCLWRTLSGQKPYLLLMNTDYNKFNTNFVERYFQQSLFYGLFPSMFSHNASENPYWQNPAWYNRDRPLFKKYLPLIKRVAEAGWQPITGARCDNAKLLIERFGSGSDGSVYLTLLNTATTTQSGILRLTAPLADKLSAGKVTELLSNTSLTPTNGGWAVTIPAGATIVVQIEPGPRFASARIHADQQLQLAIETPLEFAHVLEYSNDLAHWETIETNTPAIPSYTLQLAMFQDTPSRFYRLRW